MRTTYKNNTRHNSLRDVAINWYESWELSRGEGAPPAVWDEFVEAF